MEEKDMVEHVEWISAQGDLVADQAEWKPELDTIHEADRLEEVEIVRILSSIAGVAGDLDLSFRIQFNSI